MTATDAPAVATPSAAPLPSTTAARWGAWMLAVSPAYFVLVVITNISVLAANDIPPFVDITREQMDRISTGWILLSVLYCVAFILGGIGVALLGTALARGRISRWWAWAATVVAIGSVVLYLPYAPFRIAAMAFTEDRLGDNRWYTFWEPMSYLGMDLAITATAFLCAALFAGTVRRRTGLVVGVIAVVYLVAAIALPMPPFVISFLWCALGIVWLRSIRTGRTES
ncbi:MAG: hypothetical protein ABWY55_06305 [Microbacterium sp.]